MRAAQVHSLTHSRLLVSISGTRLMSGITTPNLHHSAVLDYKTPCALTLATNKPIQYHQCRQYHPSLSQRFSSILPEVKTVPNVASRLQLVAKRVNSGSPSLSSPSSRRAKSLVAPEVTNTVSISGKTATAPRTAFSKSRVATTNLLQSTSYTSSTPDPKPKLPFLHYQTNDAREVLYTRDEDEANKWLSDIK